MSACRLKETKAEPKKIIELKEIYSISLPTYIDSTKCSKAYKAIMQRASLTSSSSLLDEPIDNKYKEYADKIQKGNWLELEFNDTGFISNLYKALREDLINTYQLVTAMIWHDGIIIFQDSAGKTSIALHKFAEEKDEKEPGPYNPATISYATSENMHEFKKSLKELPPAERTYLTITVPPGEHEAMFLFCGLGNRLADSEITGYTTFFTDALKKFIKKHSFSTEEKDKLCKYVDTIQEEKSHKELTLVMTNLVIHYFPDISSLHLSRGNSTCLSSSHYPKFILLMDYYNLMTTILLLNEQKPAFIISPDSSDNDIKSPLLSIVLPTTSALMKLQSALHHSHTTFPHFTAGKLTTRDLLHTLVRSKNQERAVELYHPELKHGDQIHGGGYSSFLMLWHDLYLHVWRNGANIYKDLVLHLITALQKYKKIEMSKTIWALVDMDTNLGRYIRDRQKLNTLVAYKKIESLSYFLDKVIGDFWSTLDRTDHTLLFIVDMILHREKWKESLGNYPENFFPKETSKDNIWVEDGVKTTITNALTALPFNYSSFQLILANMKKIIEAYPQKDTHTAALFYISAYRLKGHTAGLDLLNKLNEIGLDQFLGWHKNDGIIALDKSYKSDKVLEKLSGEDFYNELNKIASFDEYVLLNPDKLFDKLIGTKPYYPENRLAILQQLRKLISEYALIKTDELLFLDLMRKHIHPEKTSGTLLFHPQKIIFSLDTNIENDLRECLRKSLFSYGRTPIISSTA